VAILIGIVFIIIAVAIFIATVLITV